VKELGERNEWLSNAETWTDCLIDILGNPHPIPLPKKGEGVLIGHFPLLSEERTKVRSSFDKFKIKG